MAHLSTIFGSILFFAGAGAATPAYRLAGSIAAPGAGWGGML